jgi:threonine dehydratase
VPAWPTILQGVDAFISIPDSFARQAMSALRANDGDPCIEAGPSGACGIGALLALGSEAELARVRRACGFNRSTRVSAVVTEGK